MRVSMHLCGVQMVGADVLPPRFVTATALLPDSNAFPAHQVRS